MKGHTISLQQDILKQMATTFAGRMQSVVEDVTVIFQHVTRHTETNHSIRLCVQTMVPASLKNQLQIGVLHLKNESTTEAESQTFFRNDPSRLH